MPDGKHDEDHAYLAEIRDPSRATLTLAEQIANSLAEDIIKGVYAPGQPLLEIPLAEAYKVSRGPIRDALQLLQVEGLVVIQPRRGATVTVLTPQKIKEVFEVRSVLYGFIAAEVAAQRAPGTLKRLHQATERLKSSLHDGTDTFFTLMYALSLQFVDAGQNHYARRFLSSLSRLTLPVTRKVMRDERNRAAWIANWEAVLASIERGDGRAADEAARRWILAMYAKDLEIAEDEPAGSRKGAAAGAVNDRPADEAGGKHFHRQEMR
jgi:DNA-binding GntR family transcriptional regulator